MDPAEHGPRGDLNPDPADLERRLARLRPAAGGLDRGRMLYEAGRAAAHADSRAGARLASAAALALAAGCVGLGGLLARERGHRLDAEQALAAARPRGPDPGRLAPPPVLAVRPDPDSYLALTRRALVAGLDDPPGPHEARRGGPPDDPEPPLRVRGPGVPLSL